MRPRAFEIALWMLTFGMGVVAGFRTKAGGQNTRLEVPAIPTVLPAPTRFDVDTLERAQRAVVESNPFRIARRPSNVAFGTEPVSATQEIPTIPPKPQIQLRGIVGPPWEAVIDGLPDRSGGTVVKTGDRIGELSIDRITRDSIRISGMDTVWTLTLERPWH